MGADNEQKQNYESGFDETRIRRMERMKADF